MRYKTNIPTVVNKKQINLQNTLLIIFEVFNLISQSSIQYYLNSQNVLFDELKVNNNETRKKSLTSFWCFYYELRTDFSHFSGVSVIKFEQKNDGSVETEIYGFLPRYSYFQPINGNITTM